MTLPSKTLICFDLDDTLIDDNWKFETTFCDCMKTILLALAAHAPTVDEILRMAREMDNQLLDELPKDKKYTPSRLTQAWQTTYKTISERQEIPVKPHIMNMLEGYVLQNFEPPYLVIAGAVDALIHIRNLPNIEMHVATIGDPEIQLRKINYARLNFYFDHVEIVQDSDDKGEYLRQMSEQYGADNVIMIGNSIRSDINPALAIGLKAIYIPRGSWSRFKAEPLNDSFAQVHRIFELPQTLEGMLGLNA